MSTIEIVEYGPPYEEAHTRFAAKCWPTKRRRRDPVFNRWKFRGPAEGPVPGLLLAVSEGEVVGQTGALPGLGRVGGETMPIQWICDLMVDADHRRKGITTKLLDVALARPMLTVSSDPSPNAAKVFGSVGMVEHTSSHLMVLTLDAGPVVTMRYPQVARLAPLVSLAGAAPVAYTNRRLGAARSTSDAVLCPWADLVPLIADQESTIDAPHAIHDEDFLSWRCRGLEGFNRELEAIVTPGGSFAVLERSSAHLAVHQWRATDDREAASLFARVAYVARSYGYAYVQTFAIDAAAKARLEPLGFRARRTPVDMWAYPSERIDVSAGGWAFWGYDSDYQL